MNRLKYNVPSFASSIFKPWSAILERRVSPVSGEDNQCVLQQITSFQIVDERCNWLIEIRKHSSGSFPFGGISKDSCRILTARLAMLQDQSDRTQTLLDAAECQLVMALTADEADRSPLMDIIHSVLMLIASTSQGRLSWQ